MEFVKLQKGNDWGNNYVYLNSDGATSRDRLIVKDGELCVVRFPDETIQTVVIKHVSFSGSVGDHGRSYDVTSSIPGFHVQFRGLQLWISLDQVEVEKDWATKRGPISIRQQLANNALPNSVSTPP